MARRAQHASSLLWIFVALAGCAEGSPLTGEGAPCVTNRECSEDQICVGGSCHPTKRPTCQTDDGCALGQFCDMTDHTCKPETTTTCTNDDACPARQRCNTTTGVCIDGARSCTSEAQCVAIGQHCDPLVQQCRECVQTTHCSDGKECRGGICVDPGTPLECTGDFGCSAPSTVCESGQCVAGCSQAGSPIVCGSGTVCNTNTGRCVPGQVTCAADAECGPPGRICESMQCIPGCTQPGGLQCTGGNVCDPASGRCVNPGSCSADAECSPPARVCESSTCVPGCSQAGGIQCVAGEVCNTNTGRCVPVSGPCTTDANCSSPTQVCESGQCIPGCAQPGGIQCTGNTVCNASSGRCDPGPTVCTNDAACGAPSNICNMNTGACIPGCASSGCTAPDTCNTATGRCQGPNTGLALDAACTANADCASKVCFNLDGVGQRCVQSCGNSADCPASFTCYDFNGAKMCLSRSLFTGATFANPTGGSCSGGGECKSNYCDANRCAETCNDNADCGGSGCVWDSVGSNIWIMACTGPIGPGPQGSACSGNGNCASGVCFQNQCADLCGSSNDCPNGRVCSFLDASVCTVEIFGLCVRWAPNFLRACVPQSHGSQPVGTGCTDYTPCRSGLCYVGGGLNQCTDVCAEDSDCPGTHRCKVTQYGQLGSDINVYINVCLPEGL